LTGGRGATPSRAAAWARRARQSKDSLHYATFANLDSATQSRCSPAAVQTHAEPPTEWAADGIALHCIGPGAVINEGLAGEAAGPPLNRLVQLTPMGCTKRMKKEAELMALLASPVGQL